MEKVKIKLKDKKTIKHLDRTVILADKTKNITNSIKNSSNSNINDDSITDYGNQKIKELTKDSTILTKNKAKKEIKKTPRRVKKTALRTKKVAKKSAKAIKKTTETSIKASKKAYQITKKVTKLTIKGIKITIKATISAIKGIIAGTKALISAIAAGGWIAVIIILVICLIGLLCASMFGIFFSSDSSNQIKMSDCIMELNEKMDSKIEEIKKQEIHDEVIVDSNQASWKDILSIYAVRVSNGNSNEVMSITPEKKKILEEVFWDMNYLTHETITEKYKVKTIDSRVDVNVIGNSNYQRPNASDIKHYDVETESEVEKRVLHININSRSLEELKNKYNFNALQIKQYNELSSDKYLMLWSTAIYGIYGSSGEITTWKQKGREWSNIRIGNSSKTIGDVGCLVTSVAILIKKSGVPTKNIYPFNPGTFVTALNNVHGFDGANLQYGPISKVVPGFVYQDRVILKGKTKEEKLALIRKYQDSGYYLAIEVLGATENAQHWVAIDKVVDNRIYMIDSGSNEVDLWKQYDWDLASQFIYFKVVK